VVDAPLNPPVVFASTYIGAHDVTAAEIGYGRYSNPTWQALEEAIGALEGGQALTFASGMAAAHAVLELIPPGAVVVIPHNCYLGVAAAIDRRAETHGWQVRQVDVADTTEVLTAADGADLVWIESPTNPTIEVADLPALGKNLPTIRSSSSTAPSLRRCCNAHWNRAPTSCCTQPRSCCRATPTYYSGR
jgi:cystathionine gamma-synthase